jgi:hypothetical protein
MYLIFSSYRLSFLNASFSGLILFQPRVGYRVLERLSTVRFSIVSGSPLIWGCAHFIGFRLGDYSFLSSYRF